METYSIETVIEGVGWLRAAEELAICEVLGHGATIHFDQVGKHVHLCWRVDADTVDDAIETSRTTLRDAAYATGVYSPHASFFSVRQIDQ